MTGATSLKKAKSFSANWRQRPANKDEEHGSLPHTSKDEEDDRYGRPTHTCKYCTVCFPATWEHDHVDDTLKVLHVDLILSGPEAVAAVKDGCEFYLRVMYPKVPGNETSRIKIRFSKQHVDRKQQSLFEYWVESKPYFEGAGELEGHNHTPPQQETWEDLLGLAMGDWHEHDKLVMYPATEHVNTDPWFLGALEPPNLNPRSQPALERMRTWLQDCIVPREAVSDAMAMSPTIMPKRLLEIDPESDAVHLTTTTEEAKFALLSYCWGGNQRTKTMKHNLARYEKGISVDTLPRTIRDAIDVTRSIGLRHLWVDALCIVQDDTEELAQEIGKQAKLYQNGAFTILAGGAANADEGFLSRRSSVTPRYNICMQFRECEWQTLLIDVFRKDPQPDPVASRAWILQEGTRLPAVQTKNSLAYVLPVLLSPKVLYFSPIQLNILSGSDFWTDGGPPVVNFPDRRTIQMQEQPDCDCRMCDVARSAAYTVPWHDVLSKYTRLEMSEPMDVLPAISAIADAICDSDHVLWSRDYMAGLWVQDMPMSLLWGIVPNQRKARPAYRAPSWSWASVIGGITGGYPWQSPYGELPLRAVVSGTRAEIQLASDDAPFGEVLGGKLQITGLLKEFPHYAISGGQIQLFDEQYDLHENFDLDAIEPEIPEESTRESSVSILCFVRFLNSADSTREYYDHCMWGLILRKGRNMDVYTRIGRFVLNRENAQADEKLQRWQETFEMETVTIV